MHDGPVLAEARSGQSRTSSHQWSSVNGRGNTSVVETRQLAPADLTDKGLVRASG
jgi:hypothetical protein